MATPRMTRSQGPAENIDLDHPNGQNDERDWLNVEKELSFYSAYHSNFVNKCIHLVCIPLITWATLLLLAYLALPGTEPHVIGPNMAWQPSAALAVLTGFVAYYIALDPIGGALVIPWAGAMYLTATYTRAFPPAWLPYRNSSSSGNPTAVWWGVILELVGWISQFIGHGVFEKRAPALLTNLGQALVLAPFFVHLELLFAVVDYKPELHKKVKNLAGLRIRDMNRARRAKTE